MDGNTTMTVRAVLATVALLALGGSISGANAADGAGVAPVAVAIADQAKLPRFEPSFAESFEPFSKPAEVALPDGAVDLAAIEPAVEDDGDAIGGGVASWYGRGFAGHRTASGERFDPADYTAAHRTLPFGSRVRVTNAAGHSVVVRINDRGPYSGHRVIDLSQAAAAEIGLVGAGSGRVTLSLIND